MPLLVGLLFEPEGLLAIGSVGNDGLGAAVLEPLAQFCTVVGLVAEELAGRFGAADQARGGRTIVRLASGQQDGKKTAFSICDCVDLRIAPSS